jgi:hypothetical protein
MLQQTSERRRLLIKPDERVMPKLLQPRRHAAAIEIAAMRVETELDAAEMPGNERALALA